jgi:hypothetical protein
MRADHASLQADERGYTLVALMAVMTLMTLFALAAAPNILQQAQRQREQEAIFVAKKWRMRYVFTTPRKTKQGTAGDPALPTSIDDLLEGTATRHYEEAASVARIGCARSTFPSGEWQLVRPRSSRLADFQRALILYAGNAQPKTTDPQLSADERFWPLRWYC